MPRRRRWRRVNRAAAGAAPAVPRRRRCTRLHRRHPLPLVCGHSTASATHQPTKPHAIIRAVDARIAAMLIPSQQTCFETVWSAGREAWQYDFMVARGLHHLQLHIFGIAVIDCCKYFVKYNNF